MPSAAQPPIPSPVDAAMRGVLTASAHSRIALARRLGMGLRDVEAVEHVMVGAAPEEQSGHAPRPLGTVDLSRLLGVTSAAGTQALHRLEGRGHVRRVPHPADGRRLVLEVTDTGRDHVMAELGPLLARLGEVSSRLTPAESEVVVRYLQQVAQVLDAYADEPPADD